MDGDTYVGETTEEGFFQRLCSSFGSLCCGIIMVPILIVVIFYNESNFVKSEATASLVKKAHEVHGCTPGLADNDKFVFAACPVFAPDLAGNLPTTLQHFVPSFHGASIAWSTEIYQWTETEHENCQKNNHGGKTCTHSYTYSQSWETGPVDSSTFRDPQNHQNLGTIPAEVSTSETWAQPFSVVLSGTGSFTGGFELDRTLMEELPEEAVPLTSSGASAGYVPGGSLTFTMLRSDGSYLTTASGQPRVGDIRISLSGHTAKEASAVGVQKSRFGGSFTFTPLPPQKFDFWGRMTYPLEKLYGGSLTKDEFESEMHNENLVFAWVVRILCLVGMIAAFACCLQPISVSMDLIRMINCFTCGLGTLLDNIGQTLICLLSTCCGCSWFWFFLCIAWLCVHPTLSVILILVIVGLLVAFTYFVLPMLKEQKADAREVGAYLQIEEGEPVRC